ncbi:MAG: MFS transporter [Chloroflexi bacterium]|nr:MFS transporter [Chloroflexota bacterium]
MKALRDRDFIATILGHFSIDLLNSQVSLILAVLSVPLALSNSQIGLVGMAYTFANSLTQPLFGWWADRFGSRFLAVSGPLWMGTIFALAIVSPGYFPLVLMVLAALGSAAYHPQGTGHATEAGERYAGVGATAAALFFMAGQGAFSIGPIVGGQILDRVGLYGMLAICAVPIVGGLVQWAYFHPVTVVEAHPAPAAHSPTKSQFSEVGKVALAFFVLAVFLRSWAQFGIIYYVPRFLADAGKSSVFYGNVLSAFMLATAAGGVLGGALADRIGEVPVLFFSLVLGALPTGAFPWAGGTAMLLLIAASAGLFLGAGHTLIVVIAQRLVPGKRATASGLALGFMFASGGAGMFFSGILADRVGLATVLQGQGVLVLVSAGAVLAWRALR